MKNEQLPALKNQLLQLLKERALKRGDFVLSSGKKSTYYLDGRIITLTPEGAYLVARIVLELIRGKHISALGGPSLGADPIVGAVAALSYIEHTPLKTFIIRKQAKEHGMKRLIEGPAIETKDKIILVDDVLTTGKSILEAQQALLDSGLQAHEALVIVDRREGAGEQLSQAGIALTSIFTIEELGV